MMTYFKSNEIQALMRQLVKFYVEDCIRKEEISVDFVELIKHNFMAKYVFYNKKKRIIEIGVNESTTNSGSYPEIKVYRFPLEKADKWFESTWKKGKIDLDFYGRLLSGNSSLGIPKVVVV